MAEYVFIYCIGLVLAVLSNIGIYRLAFFPRRLGPYSQPPADHSPRTWLDRIPIIGWWFLRREAKVHGAHYWVRPLLIELIFPFAVLALFHWERTGGLLPVTIGMNGVANAWSIVRIQACAHILLATLLLIATFIDFDERSIPDSVTVVGALVALVGATIFPGWHLLITGPPNGGGVEPINPASPDPFQVGWYGTYGLQLAILNYSIWCFALADRRLIFRRGPAKAIEYFLAGLVRHSSWKILLGMWLIGSFLIFVGHQTLPHEHWKSLFTSLVGMTLGCAIVWIIRIVARVAMGVEALGFGDVTLMAMVGAFLGWQPVWIAFFAAPCMALVFILFVWLLTRDATTPFGPYLAAGSMAVVVGWTYLWEDQVSPRLLLVGADFVFVLLAGFLLIMGVVMWLLQVFKRAFR